MEEPIESWSGRRNWHKQHNTCRLLYKEIRHEVVAKVFPKCIIKLHPSCSRNRDFCLDNEEFVWTEREYAIAKWRYTLLSSRGRFAYRPFKSKYRNSRHIRYIVGPKDDQAQQYLEPLVGDGVYKWVYVDDNPRCHCSYSVKARGWTAFLKEWGYHYPILY